MYTFIYDRPILILSRSASNCSDIQPPSSQHSVNSNATFLFPAHAQKRWHQFLDICLWQWCTLVAMCESFHLKQCPTLSGGNCMCPTQVAEVRHQNISCPEVFSSGHCSVLVWKAPLDNMGGNSSPTPVVDTSVLVWKGGNSPSIISLAHYMFIIYM